MSDEHRADEHAGRDAREPRRRQAPPSSTRVQPHDERDGEPAAEDAERVAAERARRCPVRQDADEDEDEQQERVYKSRTETRTNHVSIAA